MSTRSPAKEELIRRVSPVIMRIARACDGVGAGIASYGLASMLAVAWRKTGLSKQHLHALIDELLQNDATKDAN